MSKGLGLDAIAAHEQRLLELATAELQKIPGVEIIGTAAHKAAVHFVHDGGHPPARHRHHPRCAKASPSAPGHHCAMPVMDFFEVPATARASFACYNTVEEVGRLVAALRKSARGVRLMELQGPLSRRDPRSQPRSRAISASSSTPNARADGHNPLCGDRLTLVAAD